MSVQIDAERMRPVDIPLLEADISRLRDHTNGRPDTPLDTTLKETLDYGRAQVALSTT
jgi:GDP-4-dehydro-6-deoxy-D-mannose reductase